MLNFAISVSNQFAILQKRPRNLPDMRTNIPTLENISPTLLSRRIIIYTPSGITTREREVITTLKLSFSSPLTSDRASYRVVNHQVIKSVNIYIYERNMYMHEKKKWNLLTLALTKEIVILTPANNSENNKKIIR